MKLLKNKKYISPKVDKYHIKIVTKINNFKYFKNNI